MKIIATTVPNTFTILDDEQLCNHSTDNDAECHCLNPRGKKWFVVSSHTIAVNLRLLMGTVYRHTYA